MRIFEVCLFSIPLENPTCVPNFKPDVDHAHHSASSKTSYYVVPEGWKPGVYTNSKAADEQIEGYSGYIRFKVATYKNALEAWKSHCQRNHGVDCPDAVPTYWGIKNYPVIFNSRSHSSMAFFSSLAPELRHRIVQAFVDDWHVADDPEAGQLKPLAGVDAIFHTVIQPFLFRHLNIRTLRSGLDLFDLFAFPFSHHVNLAAGLRTLHLSLDLKPGGYNKKSRLHLFWQRWQTFAPRMVHLDSLSLCVDMEDDTNCLQRFLANAHLDHIPSLRTFHITPSQDYWPHYERGAVRADAGPWDSDDWPALLAHPSLVQLTSFVFTTPGYPFWPPTPQGADTLCQNWFSQLPITSNLGTFVLHFGYFDEGERHEDNSSSHERLNPQWPTTIWPPFLEASWTWPTVVCERSVDLSWRISEDKLVYCGWGQHRFFHVSAGSETVPGRIRFSPYIRF
ncbi:hypothetical protein B0H12DRAFT_1270402 [Mycena haematopus]|nr:hypothetical protein B0H12DRAFT_1270402 [Mycena haematopus]